MENDDGKPVFFSFAKKQSEAESVGAPAFFVSVAKRIAEGLEERTQNILAQEGGECSGRTCVTKDQFRSDTDGL